MRNIKAKIEALIGLSILSVGLAACTGAESAHTHGRVLKDMKGCAFIARTDIGDSVFLNYSQELSDKTCDFKTGG